MTRFGWAAGAALVALLLAGCGGDNSPTATPTSSRATTTGGSSETTSSGGSSDTTAPDDATTTSPSFEGSGGSDFCAFAKDLESSDFADSLTGDDSSLKEQFEQIDDVMGKIKDKAPSEIKDDVNALVEAFAKYGDFLKQYDYDMDKITEAAAKDPKVLQEATETFSDPKFATASERVSAYAAQVCGIDTATTS